MISSTAFVILLSALFFLVPFILYVIIIVRTPNHLTERLLDSRKPKITNEPNITKPKPSPTRPHLSRPPILQRANSRSYVPSHLHPYTSTPSSIKKHRNSSLAHTIDNKTKEENGLHHIPYTVPSSGRYISVVNSTNNIPHSHSVASTSASSIIKLFRHAPAITLSFNSISYFVDVKKKLFDGTKETKQILYDVGGVFKSGSMSAIMGPSGCGKTTLLDILASRKYTGQIHGQIHINGSPLPTTKFKQISAYVMQDDALFPFLTVHETLMYVAEMRLNVSVEEKVRKVRKVMKDLELLSISNQRVGEEEKGGLSRGQKRRITVGIELITSPSIIFLDEPTSGLDAYSSLQLMKLLKKLAHKGGRTIICTIHQPRSDIFSMFDTLFMMVAGKIAYYGSIDRIPQYFMDIGYTIPMTLNPADFIVDLTNDEKQMEVSNELVTPKSTLQTHKTVDDMHDDDHLEDIILEYNKPSKLQDSDLKLPPINNKFIGVFSSKPINNNSNFTEKISSAKTLINSNSIKQLHDIDAGEMKLNKLSILYNLSTLKVENEKELSVYIQPNSNVYSKNDLVQNNESVYATGYYTQFSTILQRSHTNNTRNPGFYITWIVGGISFLFYGFIYLGLKTNHLLDNIDKEQSGDVTMVDYWDAQKSFLFQIVTAIVFLQIETLTSAFLEKKTFFREFASGVYSPFSYHSAWVVRMCCFGFLKGLVFPPLVYFMSGLSITAHQYSVFVLVFCLMDAIGASLSLFLICLTSSLEASSALFTTISAFVGSCCGFFLSPGLIPIWFVWSYYLSWYKYALNALYINEFGDDSVTETLFEVDSGLDIWLNLLVLFIYPITLHFLAYFANVWKTRPKKIVI